MIGITGHKGSGKGILVNYLTEDKLYKYFSLSHVVRKQYVEEKLEENISRDNLQDFGDFKRKQNNSKHYFAKLLVNEIRENTLGPNDSLIICGIRNPGEIEFLKKLPNFHLIGIQATKKKLKQNLKHGGYIPRSLSVNEFESSYKRDCGIHSSGEFGQNIKECLKMVPKENMLKNNSDSEDLFKPIKNIIKRFGISR